MSGRFTPGWFAKRLGLAAASVLALLVLLEGVSRLVGIEPIYQLYSKPSILWRHDDLLGWSHEPGASEIYRGPRPYPIEYETRVEINSLGLRGPELQELPDGGYRVLLLGDSTVAGFEVPQEATFGAVAERELTRRLDFPVQVINAGVRGYGTDQALLYYRERGRALRPDLVVQTHSNNDPPDNVTLHRMRRPFGKAAFGLLPDGSLELVGRPIPHYPLCTYRVLDREFKPRTVDTAMTRAFCQVQIQLFDHSSLFTFFSLRIAGSKRLTQLLYGLGSPDRTAARGPEAAGGSRRLAGFGFGAALAAAPEKPGPDPRRGRYDYELTTALLIELARSVRADGAAFLLYIGPDELARLDAGAFEREIDLLLPLSESGTTLERRYRFDNDYHFNALGHQRFARPLIDRIEGLARASRAP